MRRHQPSLIFTLLALIHLCRCLFEDKFISFENSKHALEISNATIIVHEDDFVGIHIAVGRLSQDFRAITGQALRVLNVTATEDVADTVDTAILVGSLTESSLIDALAKNNIIDVSNIEGKWESFKTFVIEDPIPNIKRALVIAGSDKRGSIFGIYTLAEQSGQSPWYWWADVPAKKHSKLYAPAITTKHGEPAVKYRGFFINDEAPALESWWAERKGNLSAKLDLEFHEMVFELTLRLKANYFWPASWSGWPWPGNIFFTDDPRNQQAADDWGVTIGTSHHEIMQRATNEWSISGLGPYNWETNRENLTRYMREGVKRAGRNESYFTVGMRGEGDGAVGGSNPIEILEDIYSVQRSLLEEEYGNASAVPQVWSVYKEVMTYYEAGLRPPEDVTILFTDDNFGNPQRLPTPEEAARPGGIGMYFHLEYVGVPRSYKWTNTNSLAKILKDMSQAYATGVRQMWMINVGDIKPMELPLSFLMDLAWYPDRITFETLPDYFIAYATREFGKELGIQIAEILTRLDKLLALRRYEHIESDTLSIVNFQEAVLLLQQWEALDGLVGELLGKISSECYPAFFQLVEYPVTTGYMYYLSQIYLGMNQFYGDLQRRTSTSSLAQHVMLALEQDFEALEQYDKLLHGKWRNIMSQPKHGYTNHWKAPIRDAIRGLVYVPPRSRAIPARGNLGVEGAGPVAPLPELFIESCERGRPRMGDAQPRIDLMEPHGSKARYIELYMQSDIRMPIHWTATPSESWILLDRYNGTLDSTLMDDKVWVSINWTAVPANLRTTATVTVQSHLKDIEHVLVPIHNHRVPCSFTGYPEADSVISFEAPHYTFLTSSSTILSSASEAVNITFTTTPHLGTRSTSGTLSLSPFLPSRSSPSSSILASAHYTIYLFTSTSDLTATLYFTMGLNTKPDFAQKFSLTLDSSPAEWHDVIPTANKPGELPPGWEKAVQDNAWTVHVSLGAAREGKHEVVYRTNSPEVYLEKVVLATRKLERRVCACAVCETQKLKEAYLGVPETGWVDGSVDGDCMPGEVEGQASLRDEL